MEGSTNELSYICLNAIASVKLVKLKLNVRDHLESLLEESCFLVPIGTQNQSYFAGFSILFDDCFWCGIQKFFFKALFSFYLWL